MVSAFPKPCKVGFRGVDGVAFPEEPNCSNLNYIHGHRLAVYHSPDSLELLPTGAASSNT